MGLALVAESPATESSVSAYVALDQRVDGAEEDGLIARWEFGKMLLVERAAHGGRQLPNGRLDELSAATGKGRRELQRRLCFAEQYDSEDKVRHACHTFGSWYGIVKDGLIREPKHSVPEPDKPITEDDLWRLLENRLLDSEAAIAEFKARKHPAATALSAGLAQWARVVRDAQR